jgi:formylglycine-generating enzyme required for sulfatase activity
VPIEPVWKKLLVPALSWLAGRLLNKAKQHHAVTQVLEGGDAIQGVTLHGLVAKAAEELSGRRETVASLHADTARQWLLRPETVAALADYILARAAQDAPRSALALAALEGSYEFHVGERGAVATGAAKAAADAVFVSLHIEPETRAKLQFALSAMAATGGLPPAPTSPDASPVGEGGRAETHVDLLPFLERRRRTFSDRQMQGFVPLRLLRTEELAVAAADDDPDSSRRAEDVLSALWALDQHEGAQEFDDLGSLLSTFETADPLFPKRPVNRCAWILVGAPGSGKSTVLAAFERRCVERLLESMPAEVPETADLCLRLGLGAYDVRDGVFQDPEAWIRGQWADRWEGLPVLAPALEELTQSFRVRLMLDGLNEIRAISAEQREQAATVWARWLARRSAGVGLFASSPPPVFTVRTLNVGRALRYHDDISGLHAAPWRVDVDAMDTGRIQTFVFSNAGAAASTLWPAIESNTPLLRFFSNPFNLFIQCEYARARGSVDVGAPLLRSRADLMCAQLWNWLWRGLVGRCPPEESMIVDSVLSPRDRDAVAGWRQSATAHLHDLPDEGDLLRGLGDFAWRVHSDNDGALVVLSPREAMAAAFPSQQLATHEAAVLRAEAWWRAVMALNLVCPPEDGRRGIQFAHHLHQEFHAACRLAAPSAPVLRPGTLAVPELDVEAFEGRVVLPQPSPWEECIKMAVVMSARPDELVASALADGNLGLAARALLTQREARGLWGMQRGPLTQALLARIGDVSQHLGVRWEAAICLGLIGDHLRYAEWCPSGTKHAARRLLLPDASHWIWVPHGPVELGADLPDGQFLPPARVRLRQPARLAFAPVTCAEYACFLAAGGCDPDEDGNAPPWWHAVGEDAVQWWRTALEEQREGNAVLEPACWGQERFSNPLQPVVGVSAYEALAYVEWLNVVLAAPLQSLGARFSLPTEVEWEAVARTVQPGEIGLDDEGDIGPELMNFCGWYQGPTPVGMLARPSKDGAPIAVDMQGNVWEWTRTYEPGADGQLLCTRGGSWADPAFGCHVALRFFPDAGDRDDNIGFRLALCGDSSLALPAC